MNGFLKEQNYLKLFKAVLFLGLMVLYYCFYMREAMNNYFKKRTTITERQQDAENGFSPPVLVICPIPAFRADVFRKYKVSNIHEKFFWQSGHSSSYFNDSVSMPEIYQEMAFEYLADFNFILNDLSEKESSP